MEISESSYFHRTEPLLTSAAKIQGHQQKRQAGQILSSK